MPHHQDIGRDYLLFRFPNDFTVIIVADVGDQTVESGRDLCGRFASGTAVAPDVPAFREVLGFTKGADFGRGDAFVVAVVPFRDARVDGDLGGGGVGAVGGGMGLG